VKQTLIDRSAAFQVAGRGRGQPDERRVLGVVPAGPPGRRVAGGGAADGAAPPTQPAAEGRQQAASAELPDEAAAG